MGCLWVKEASRIEDEPVFVIWVHPKTGAVEWDVAVPTRGFCTLGNSSQDVV